MTSQAVRGHHQILAAAAGNGEPGPVLLLSPSRGLGGGIERYVETLQSAFQDQEVAHQRVDLRCPGLRGHRALLAEATASLTQPSGQAQVVVAHRALLPVAVMLARIRPIRGITVICHGVDVWGDGVDLRWQLESRLMRHPKVRIVAVSSFTAGSLFPIGRAVVLPPGLSANWFDELVGADSGEHGPRTDVELMTAFRLSSWRDKGLPQLTAAVVALGRPDVRLTVCGSGDPPADLLAHIKSVPRCTLRAGLSDRELAAQFARSDLFVLASRTRRGRRVSGEGFGLVLLEAQVAGTAVIGPAHGGSLDAYLDGVSGATPTDESEAALSQVLDAMLRQRSKLSEMGERGAQWARVRFAPDRYAALAVKQLL